MKPFLDAVPPSGIRKIFDTAMQIEKSGKKVFHFEIGRPDFDSPPAAKVAAMRALNEGKVHYTENRGVLELRKAIALKLQEESDLEYDIATEIIVTSGTTEAIAMIMSALVGPGDEVIVPTPAWSHYDSCTVMFGGVTKQLPLKRENDYQLEAKEVEKLITKNTRLLVVNSPNNPTGAVFTEKNLREIFELCKKHNIYILSDEIYDYFSFDGTRHVSIASFPGAKEICILINGFSKAYSMTGWRIGYAASSEEVSQKLNKAHQYLTVCANSFAQYGAAVMLGTVEGEKFVETMTTEFAKRWKIVTEALSKISCLKLPNCSGAFYVFPSFEYKGMNSQQFCSYLLEEGGVATVPGNVFGDHFDNCFRLAYSASEADLRGGLEVMQKLLS